MAQSFVHLAFRATSGRFPEQFGTRKPLDVTSSPSPSLFSSSVSLTLFATWQRSLYGGWASCASSYVTIQGVSSSVSLVASLARFSHLLEFVQSFERFRLWTGAAWPAVRFRKGR